MDAASGGSASAHRTDLDGSAQIVLSPASLPRFAVRGLLRTASPNLDAASGKVGVGTGNQEQLSVTQIDDCTITPEQAPQLASSDAAQLVPVAPFGIADVAVSRIADARTNAVAPPPDATVPRPQHQSFRITIRPPPASSVV